MRAAKLVIEENHGRLQSGIILINIVFVAICVFGRIQGKNA
jgi:hypothetical protein